MAKNKTPHVVLGGRTDEIAHCQHCGQGLSVRLPQGISVVTGALKGFTKDHAACKPVWKEPIPKTPEEWLFGRDTGASSHVIYDAMSRPATHSKILNSDKANPPRDADDFGRCYRLLKLFPVWRTHFQGVADYCPRWQAYVDAWDDLTAIYERDLPTGKSDELMERLEHLAIFSQTGIARKKENQA